MTDRDPVRTIREIAKQLRVDRHKVAGWIRSGELIARNVAAWTSSRPVYRITAADLAAFLDARASTPTPAPAKQRIVRREAYQEYV